MSNIQGYEVENGYLKLASITPILTATSLPDYKAKAIKGMITECMNDNKQLIGVDIAGVALYGYNASQIIFMLSKDFVLIDSSSEYNNKLLENNRKYAVFNEKQSEFIIQDYKCSTIQEVLEKVKQLQPQVTYTCHSASVFPVILLSQCLNPSKSTWYLGPVESLDYVKYVYKMLYYKNGMFDKDIFYNIIKAEDTLLYLKNDSYIYPIQKGDYIQLPGAVRGIPLADIYHSGMFLPGSLGVKKYDLRANIKTNPFRYVTSNIAKGLSTEKVKQNSIPLDEFLKGGN